MNTGHFARPSALALGLASALLLVGCTEPKTVTTRSGLMEYLYPKEKAAPQPNPRGARLQLPLKVGVAFVPGGTAGWRESVMDPVLEAELLTAVKGCFKDRPWVGDLKVIPSAYLQKGSGFEGLDGVRAMFGVDVVALVSVSQVQHSDPKWYSFTYLTILGAYVVRADANETKTLIDAAVFDIPTRTFLFRAPGESTVKGSTAWVDKDRRLREASAEGFRQATKALATNLDREVEAFKAQVAQGDRKDVDLIDRRGQSLQQTGGKNWGGALPAWQALVGMAVLALAWRRRV